MEYRAQLELRRAGTEKKKRIFINSPSVVPKQQRSPSAKSGHVKQHISVPPVAITAGASLTHNSLRLNQILLGRLFVRTNNLASVQFPSAAAASLRDMLGVGSARRKESLRSRRTLYTQGISCRVSLERHLILCQAPKLGLGIPSGES